MENYADLMFQGVVAELQKSDGSFEKFQTYYPHRTKEALDDNEIDFIRRANSFYIASITEDGWPYVQHRGGDSGFVKVHDGTRLLCADYHGNRQFISQGNLTKNNRVSLFFMDYLNHARLKIQGEATLKNIDDVDEATRKRLHPNDPPAERVLEINIIAMDWNCPKYIPTLYSEDALRQIIGPQMGRLQAENEQLKAQLKALLDQQELK